MPTLLTDIPQAFALAFVLYWILSEQAFDGIFGFLNTLALGIAFPMIKQVGLAFLSFSIVLFAFQGILKRVSAKKLLLQIVGLTSIPLGVFGIWKIYIKHLGVTDMRAIEGGTGQFDFAKVNLSDLALVLLHRKPGIMQDTLNNYYKALFERNISSSIWLSLTFITSFMLILLLVFVFSKRYASIATKIQVKSMYFQCIFTIIGFAIGQGILFLFCFTEDEMIELRGFERYMDSLFIGELLAILMLFICYETKLIASEKSVYKRLLVLLTILCIFFSQNNLVRLLPQALGDDPNVFYKTQGEAINENTETGSNITAVYDKSLFTGWYGGYQSYVSYYANDKKLLWGTDLFSLDYENDEAKELAYSQIMQSDYLYFINITENMRAFYDSMIEDGELCDNTFYRVVVLDDSIVLLAVE